MLILVERYPPRSPRTSYNRGGVISRYGLRLVDFTTSPIVDTTEVGDTKSAILSLNEVRARDADLSMSDGGFPPIRPSEISWGWAFPGSRQFPYELTFYLADPSRNRKQSVDKICQSALIKNPSHPTTHPHPPECHRWI